MFNGPTAVQAPGMLINYVTPHRELLWHGRFSDASGAYQLSDEQGRALRRGHHAELWNAAVTGPAAPTLTRTEDVLHYTMDDLFTDSGAGRTGWDGDVTGTVTLRKDGDVLHDARLENCRLDRRCGFKTELAGAAATYTLGVSARRDVAHSSLATAIDSVWTFTSGRATGTQALDLPSVTYMPEGLDAHNRARAGSDTTITIAGDGEALRTLRVEASFDDGRTWRPLRARPAAGVWKVSIDNPSTSGFVSLRATAGDDDGDRVSQTVLRAYAVRG